MGTLSAVLSSRVRAEIFRLLFGLNAQELHLREMERQAGLSLGTVRQDLQKLVKLDLVQTRRDGNRLYYRANPDHPLAERYRVQGLALFGCLARQEQGPTSDLDLLVDFAEGATLFDLVGLAPFLEEKLGCPVDVVPRRALRQEIRDEALNQAVPV